MENAAVRMKAFLNRIPMDRDQIVLIGPPPKKLGAWVPDENILRKFSELVPAYGAIAEELGVRFVNAGEWKIDLTFDGVHFS